MQSPLRGPARASLLALLIAGPSAADEPWFAEQAAAAGLVWTHVSGAQPGRYWFPEIMGGGVGLLDYDGDGDLDVYLVQSGFLEPGEGQDVPTNRLFRNMLVERASADGATTNGDVPDFVDVTEQAGLGHAGYGMGVACGDYDGDGHVDIYVTNVGENVLYHNEGDGTFVDVTDRMKVGDVRWGTSAAFLDADGDGDLDLFLVNNLNWSRILETSCVSYRNVPDYCSPNNYNAQSTDTLYIKGRLGYQDMSRRLGLHLTSGNGLGVACADYDVDGDIDMYVANDATPNALWRNDGRAGYEDFALMGGCSVNAMGTPEAGMGVQWVDIDQDGLPDLFMTHLRRETNTFYLNRRTRSGGYRFADRTPMTGLGAPSIEFTGFGMGFHDFDHDGQLDLYLANGAVQAWGRKEASKWWPEAPEEDAEGDPAEESTEDRKVSDPFDPYAEPNQLYRGLGGTRFELVGEGTAAPVIGSSRGVAFGDLDEDGDVDVVVVDRDAGVKLLRNVAPKKGGWIGFRALTRGRIDAVGAALRLTTRYAVGEGDAKQERELVQWRFLDRHYSYLASNDPRVHLGVPQGHTVVSVAVRWPGETELADFGAREPGSYHELRQGR